MASTQKSRKDYDNRETDSTVHCLCWKELAGLCLIGRGEECSHSLTMAPPTTTPMAPPKTSDADACQPTALQ